MYIEPNTNIRILKNVPLDNTYDHTIYFSDESSQIAYFQGLQKYNLVNYTYQRVNRGVARVGIKSDLLYDCNYIMFQNTNFGAKWFYAFITSVEYLNNETSEIKFEIDDIQTWFFDYHLDYCFVEREHSETDVIGEHILPEPVETGEMKFSGTEELVPLLSAMGVCVMTVDSNGEQAVNGSVYDGVFGGAKLNIFKLEDYQAINSYLATFNQNPDNVIGIYMFPALFAEGAIPDGGTTIQYKSSAFTYQITSINGMSGTEQLDGYVPKNKKMYTYPFNMLSIFNGSGQELVTRYEYFSADATGIHKPSFRFFGTITTPVQCMVIPENYKNASQCFNESISISNFPMCSWTVDSYQAWIAQTAIPSIMDAAGSVGGAVLASGGIAAPFAGANAIGKATALVSEWYKASIQANSSRGSFNNGGVLAAAQKNVFYVGRKCCTNEYAKMADNFFTRYGYATKKLKIPNRSSRPHWNYVKTVNCTITGSIPTDAARNICSIYDNGITFWKHGSEVGNYSLDNRPT